MGSSNVLREEKSELLDVLESLVLTPEVASTLVMSREDGRDIYSVVRTVFRQRRRLSRPADKEDVDIFHKAMAFVTRSLRVSHRYDVGMGQVALQKLDQDGLLKDIMTVKLFLGIP